MAVQLTTDNAYFQNTTTYPAAPISATMWVYFNGVTNAAGAFQNLLYFNASSGEVFLELNGTSPRIKLGAATAPQAISAGTWYKVAIVINGASSRLWVVPATDAIGTGTGATVTNPTGMSRLGIGASGTSDEEGLNGRLANFKMWAGAGGTALTEAQLDIELNSYTVTRTANLHRAHKWITVGTVPDSGSGPNLVAAGTPTTVADPPQLAAIPGTAQASLGALAAQAEGDRTHHGTAEAQLGALSAEALGVVTSINARAELGALSATALGDVAHTATALGQLGTLTGLAQGQRETYAQMHAELGAFLAEIQGEVHVSGTATAQLGRLSARMVADIDRPDVLLTGALPHVSFWAVGEDDTSLTPLPHVLDFELSRITNGVGSLQLTYPTIGQNYALLRSIVDESRQLPVEIWIGGTPTSRMRGILVEAEGDDTEESSTWTFAGHFDEFRMRDALLAPNPTPGDDWKTWFDNETPGVVMATLLLAAQDRGTLTDITISFTDTHDSAGVEWTQAVNLELAPHRAYDDVLADLVDAGVCEWEVTPEHELRLYEPGTRGIDRTVTPVPTILRVGGGLSQAKRKYTSREAGTDLFVAGGDGLYDSTHDATARARYGRQIERSDSQNYILDDGALQAYAQNKIGAITSGAMELTVGLEFGAGRPQPSVAFNVGDSVYIDAGSGTMDRDPFEKYRVEQWTLSGSGDELSGTVSVNDVFAQRIARLEKLVRGVAGGAVVIGASVQQPDTKPPAAPTGLSASSLAYTDDQGQTLAAITASWSTVTQNSDGTALFDLSGYRVRYQYLDSTGPEGYQDAGRLSQAVSPVHTWSGVLAGSTVGVSVQAYDRTGLDSAWSSEFILIAGADATAPPVPSTPAVSNYIGLLRTDWDGTGSLGENMPSDFDRVEILASQVDDFTESDEHTVIGALRGEAAYPWSPPGSLGDVDYDITWFVKLRSVDKSGNVSALSEQGSAVPGQVAEGDIASVNIGVLTAGIMNALLIVGDKIVTGTSGSRVEIDGTQGLFCINSDEEVVFSYDIDDEILQMTGRFIAGSPSGTGARVVLDPAFLQPGNPRTFPSLLAYSDDGLLGPARINATDQPGSGVGHTALGLNSGPTDDDATYEQSTLFLWPKEAYLSVNAGGGGAAAADRRGGAVAIFKSGANVEFAPNGVTRSLLGVDGSRAFLDGRDTGGTSRSHVWANADGSIEIRGQNGTKLDLSANGDVRLGGSDNGWIDIVNGQVTMFNDGVSKTFVIEHPLNDPERPERDRWLIHACAEGPVAELLYSGEATILNGRAIVELPSYFEAAARVEGRQVQLTPVDELCMVAASRIVNGKFIIRCSGDDGTVVQWRVIATRADVEQFPVEPLKSEVDVRGDGPYRYLA